MADERQQTSLLHDQDVSVSHELSQIDSFKNFPEEKKINTDSLQQTLHETGGYTEASSYSNTQNSILHENIHHLSDHSYIHSSPSNINVQSCDLNAQDTDSSDTCLKQDTDNKDLQLSTVTLETNNSIPDINSHIHEPSNFSLSANKICLNGNLLSFNSIENSSTNVDVFTGLETEKNSTSASNSSPIVKLVNETPVTRNFNPIFVINKLDSTTTLSTPSTSHDLSTIKVPVKQTNAPLGSVENPIQIIQNGSSYLATQTLTEAQKQQITHVLQKQQAKRALETEGKSVIYDPSTNTRIVCRIVHPSELQSKNSESANFESTPKDGQAHQPNTFRGRGRPRKFHSRKIREEEKNNPALSKEEREEKKKHRPRTRSGRISKPPSYMVKDYKRIHHLDFNEEPYDDSDGGYSDYQVSDDESGKRTPRTNTLPPGVTTAKKRNYSCQVCSKAYIGRGGLSRHYRTHPSHGSMAEGEDVSTQDENSNSSLASSILSNSGCNTNSQTSSCNINNQASNSSSSSLMGTAIPQVQLPKIVSEEPASFQTVPETSSNFTALQNPETNTSVSVRTSTTSNSLGSNRRKARLREVLKSYPDQEIIEVLFPKFAQEISLWDFFVAKFSKEKDDLSIFEMLKEFEKFISHMQEESHNCLSPVNLQNAEGKTIINISSREIAAALRLETGPYMIRTSTAISEPEAKSDPRNFRLNNNASNVLGLQNDAPLFKRKRLDVAVEDVSSGLPEQILSDVIPESDNLDLPFTEGNLSSTVELATQDVHLLGSSINVDNQNDVGKGLYDLGNNTTTVTPSSLSSGCLSAVNASRTPQISLLANRSSQKLQNIQLRKLQLFGTQQQQLLPTSDITISVPVSNLSVPAECNLTELSSAPQIMNKEPIIVQKPTEMCNSSIANQTFQGLPLDSNIDIFNSSIQGLPAQAVVLGNNTESNSVVTSVPLINAAHNQNVPSDTSQTASVQTELVESVTNCLSDSQIASSLQNSSSIVTTGLSTLVPSEINMNTRVTEELREFEPTHNIISEVPKLPESSALLSHVMLPDGQVLSIWSPMENSEKVQNEQFVQNFVPGNLIILQNPDGSIQVPNNQGVPAETLQTLTTLNQGLSSESGTHAFTSVRPM